VPRHRSTGPIRRSRAARWLSGVVVGVLAVAVVVLVALAIAHARGEEPSSTPRPVPSFTAPPSTPTPTPTSTPVAAPGATERFLVVAADALWRATAGECGVTAPIIERSTDGGATWTDVTPTYRGIGQVLTLDAFAGDQAQIVARMGANCEVQALRTFTDGEFWEPNAEALAASTYIDPANPASVVTPAAPVAAPCATPWGLRSGNGTLGVICDGTVFQADESGAWQQVTPDAVAIAIRDGGVVAASAAEGCSGLAVAQACTGIQAPYSPAAVAASGTDVYLWLADRVTTVPGA
jgi:hypothetical protein